MTSPTLLPLLAVCLLTAQLASGAEPPPTFRAVPFRIAVPEATLTDLHRRLEQARLPPQPAGTAWALGPDQQAVQDWLRAWRRFDWRAAERRLNALPQYTAVVDGVQLHFLHQPSAKPGARALILTHGWPDSFVRFLKVLGPLSAEFHVVVPSVPGYGFSDPRPRSSKETAALWVKLMEGLGYRTFVAAGGDVGAGVTLELARHHADRVLAVHLTDVGWGPAQHDPASLSEAERNFLQRTEAWFQREGAYAMMHSTKPLTAAYGLNDSPAALLAWAASFANNAQATNEVDRLFGGREAFFTNLTVYWVTQTAGSAMAMYQLDAQAAWGGEPASPGAAVRRPPVAIALFPGDAQFPREWAVRQGLDVRRFTLMPEGGHFAAAEVPALFTRELIAAFRELLDRRPTDR
ncbi:MAG: epoxide hydrolase [Myxococcaceae bacterium]|nr:epoxide hydrolase [Myxococcaceae bacterium]